MKPYASLPIRVKAVFIDSVLFIASMFALSGILNSMGEVPDYVRVILFVLLAFLYEPIMVSLLGGTIGHARMGIRVTQKNNVGKNLSFLSAVIRYLIKLFLGWVSLLTITGSKSKQAFHDKIVGAVVLEFN